jgi:hypothetical protein
VTESDRWQYEDRVFEASDFALIQAEIERLEEAGWSLWRAEPLEENGVLLRFRYPGEWTMR